ncbi:HET-domain-containing protein [Nemania abortiva]|nr:HET-domain-containing protein [Nemania abortiva]
MAESYGIICFTDDKTIALKRQLVAGDYSSAHSCCHCKIFVVPETTPLGNRERKEFFHASMQIDEIHRLAADGCRWFTLFSNKLNYIAGIEKEEFVTWRSYYGYLPAVKKKGSVIISTQYETLNRRIYINAVFGKCYNGYRTSFYGLKQPDANTYPPTRTLLSPINTNPASNESIQLVCSWLEACSANHKCGIQNLPLSLPTFLLAIEKERVHLIDTAGMPKVRYVALSYCWGNKKPNTLLLSQNRRQMLSSIALEQLDTTIQEAIHVTRQIGFQYLWIDTLCIAQDDEKEKSVEIRRMDKIYRDATLTLVPSRAAGVQESFLSKREIVGSSQSHLTFELPYFDKSSLNPAQDRTVILIPEGATSDDMYAYTTEAWSQRAWTFQEGIVSLRRLRFGLRQTTWTCCHTATQYMDNDGWLSTVIDEESCDLIADHGEHNQASQIVNHRISRYQPEQIRSIWNIILKEYSHRRIKYQDDRLPAIASIAKGFARALDDDYICGLWKAHLHHGLLWHRHRLDRDDDDDDMSECAGFQPSWSWASIRRKIDLQDGEVFKDSDFEVVSYDIVPKSGGDEYGAMESAILHIRALILSVPEVIINDTRADLIGLSNPPYSSNYTHRWHGEFFDKPKLLVENGREKASRMNDLSRMLICTYIKVDNAKKVSRKECYHPPRNEFVDLSLLITKWPGGGPAGLLIAKEENETYRRIGYFETRHVWRVGGGVRGDDFVNRSYSDTLDKEYRSRVLYLWGGQTSVRKVTLI